jgi:SAM-dependent methyltransferase
VLLYVLPPLFEAANVLSTPIYRDAALRCMDHYITDQSALQFIHLTHFLVYQLEALIDLGRPELATPVLDRLREDQSADGSVRGIGGARWVCTPGLAQLAICWYKTGQWEPADKAMTWLESHQKADGGLLGSYGRGAAYFPHAELSWATKFYLDAHKLRVLAFFERNAGIFPTTVSPEDGRARAISSLVKTGDRVLEVGCGKGRFLQTVREVHPETECSGVDISPALLAEVPDGIGTMIGSLERIPASDSDFDVVFSVEAIEHSSNPAAAVDEMIRVTKPGGWVVVIDKQARHWGRLKCPAWERWPAVEAIRQQMAVGCDSVSAEQVAYDGHSSSDGLMVAWRGRKKRDS